MANGEAETALQTALTTYDLEGHQATLGSRTSGIANSDYHTVAEFSSGGPRWGDLALKEFLRQLLHQPTKKVQLRELLKNRLLTSASHLKPHGFQRLVQLSRQ